MSEDRLDEELHAYAVQVQSRGRLPEAAEIRRRAHRRRQHKMAAATFGVVLAVALGPRVGLDRWSPAPALPAWVATGTASQTKASPTSSPSTSGQPSEGTQPPNSTHSSSSGGGTAPGRNKVTSDVSELTRAGIALNTDVGLQVPDDGQRYLEVGTDGYLAFAGTKQTDSTMMSLVPAKVPTRTESTKNRVVITPPMYNQGTGPGSCVADIAPGVLKLATCDAQAANQVWQLSPAGDSGLFEMQGAKTRISLSNGKIMTDGSGLSGVDAIKFGQ